MFNLEDYVSHKLSGYLGKVVAYGHRMVDGTYLPTIRVRIHHHLTTSQLMFVEDLVPLWERADSPFQRNS